MTRWFRTRLKDAREKAGLSQKELAEKLGFTQPIVSLWESGDREPQDEARTTIEKFIGQFERAEAPRRAAARALNGVPAKVSKLTSEYEGDEGSEHDFSSWLAGARAKAEMTRHELARKAGLSAQGIYLIESGKIANPRSSTVRALTAALGAAPSTEVQEEIEESSKVEGVGEFRDFDPHDDDDVPTVPGVYVFYDVSDRPIYVGKATSIRTRVRSHAEKFWFKLPIVQTAAFVEIADELLRDQVETLLIKFLKKNAIINKNKRHHGDADDSD